MTTMSTMLYTVWSRLDSISGKENTSSSRVTLPWVRSWIIDLDLLMASLASF